MFSVILHQKKLSYFPANDKCFPPYFINDWKFNFEQCVDISPFKINFDV
jgi:hypothetical protein